jgi:hypothetical protein
MTTWSTARQRLGKHVSTETDTHATVKDIVGNSVLYEVRAEAVQ